MQSKSTLSKIKRSEGVPVLEESGTEVECEESKDANSPPKYSLGPLLGEGQYSKVYLGRQREFPLDVLAVKVILQSEDQKQNKKLESSITQEVTSLNTLNTPNANKGLLQIHDSSLSARMVQKEVTKGENLTGSKIMFVTLDFIKGLDLFTIIKLAGKLPVQIARYYFVQLIETLLDVDDKGICNRDIKADNILIDNKLNLRLLDWGYSSNCKTNGTDVIFDSCVGTPPYMAPEVLAQFPHRGPPVDIFSAGVLLFILVLGVPPFQKASSSDYFYKLYIYKKEEFWRRQWQAMWLRDRKRVGGWDREEMKAHAVWGSQLQDLVGRMVCEMPVDRISVGEVLGHVWVKGDVASQEELRDYMTNLFATHEAPFKQKSCIFDKEIYMSEGEGAEEIRRCSSLEKEKIDSKIHKERDKMEEEEVKCTNSQELL